MPKIVRQIYELLKRRPSTLDDIVSATGVHPMEVVKILRKIADIHDLQVKSEEQGTLLLFQEIMQVLFGKRESSQLFFNISIRDGLSAAPDSAPDWIIAEPAHPEFLGIIVITLPDILCPE